MSLLRRSALAGSAAVAVLLLTGAGPSAVVAAAPMTDNVTFCHATGATTNPFTTLTLDVSGVYTRHLGEEHQDGDDIIPPFEYEGQVYSQNWDAAGQAIHAADCKVVTGPQVAADGNGLGAELLILGSLPVAAGAMLLARRRNG